MKQEMVAIETCSSVHTYIRIHNTLCTFAKQNTMQHGLMVAICTLIDLCVSETDQQFHCNESMVLSKGTHNMKSDTQSTIQ